MLDKLRAWFRRPHDLPTTPPEPELTPEEKAARTKETLEDFNSWRGERRERDSESPPESEDP